MGYPTILYWSLPGLWASAIRASLLSVIAEILLYMQSKFYPIFDLLVYGQISSVEAVTEVMSLFLNVMILFEIPYGVLLYNLLKGVYRATYESESF